MGILMGVGVSFSALLLMYLLHSVVDGQYLPFIALAASWAFVAIDYPRWQYYLVGITLYPAIVICKMVILRSSSLYPWVIFYELSIIIMALFGTFLGSQLRILFEKHTRSY